MAIVPSPLHDSTAAVC